MCENYHFYKKEIRNHFILKDLIYYIDDFRDTFCDESVRRIQDCDPENKIKYFFEEFDKIDGLEKFEKFKKSAEKHNKHIHRFLSADIKDVTVVAHIQANVVVLDNLLDLLRRSRETLCILDDAFINILWKEEVITKANKDYIVQCLQNNGEETTLFELFNVISARNINWYGTILYAIARQKTAFFYVICEGFTIEDGISELRKLELCMDYALKFIGKQMTQYQHEKSNDNISDYGSGDETEVSSVSDSVDQEYDFDYDALLNDDEKKQVRLTMKSFQLELSEVALSGKNVIIYAPTGIGKTIVAIYIANEHLKKNPNGKVAFLVPRKHLVTQQFAAFEKYKDQEVTAIDLHSRAESSTGPLISHLDNYQVFVMTGGIFYNALTMDDGNKLSSITQFSLIFFDECHHCMKLDPYTKVMSEYIKEKQNKSHRPMPQIVGLTASPRSNNSDDRATMRKGLLELCANLDCQNFAYVKQNVRDLEEEITKPKQEVLRVSQRLSNDFEVSLVNLMDQCQTKLEKMKSDVYFPTVSVRSFPRDKFSQDYAGFVGNLQRLVNVAIDENDGKQKAFAIYRYLNAYYRGLIVHQLFNEFYAKESIDRFLDHDGETFTCSYDEEFNSSYRSKILVQEQSDNPSIEKIKHLIQKQLEDKPDSRILIFVRQVDYTNYLADILNKTTDIRAEAIVGSTSKNEMRGCSKGETNDLLMRFKNGEVQVLVATSVVEEGLDVPDCNMVICYGYVTDETALIQRLGRARSADSKYVLILPPMFAWMERKEDNNRRRNDTMMKLIHEYDQMDINSPEMVRNIDEYQKKLFNLYNKAPMASSSNKESWRLTCKSCQQFLCSSDELRVVEKSHIVCINNRLMNMVSVNNVKNKSYGSTGNYMIVESVKCKCNNQKLGHRIIYQGTPYIQLRITFCTLTCNNKSRSFYKWKDFTNICPIKFMSSEELQDYRSTLPCE